jgi:uncharacterized protein
MIVSDIAVTPVKGLGLNHPSTVDVDESGVRGDRRYALLNNGSVFNGKRLGALVQVKASWGDGPESLMLEFPDGAHVGGAVELGDAIEGVFYGSKRSARVVTGDFSAALSQYAGEALTLIRMPDGGGVDRVGFGAVSLQSTASLEALGYVLAGGMIDGRRFRMTFTVSGAKEYAEDTWIGRRVQIGEVIVVPEGNIGRCAVTKQDPDTGVPDLQTLNAIAEFRGDVPTTEPLPFGVHARVISPGRVSIGDAVLVG